MNFKTPVALLLGASLVLQPALAGDYRYMRLVKQLVVTQPTQTTTPATPTDPVTGGTNPPISTTDPGTGGTSPTPGGGDTGTTTPPPASTPVGVLSTSTSGLGFSSTAVGTTSAAQSVVVSNIGTASLSLSAIATTGPFTASHNCPATLAVNESCQVSVTFSPTTVGVESGEVKFTTGVGTTSIGLAGAGVTALTAALSNDPNAVTSPSGAFSAASARYTTSTRTFYIFAQGNTGQLAVSAALSGSSAFSLVSARKFSPQYYPGQGWGTENAACGTTVSATSMTACQADAAGGYYNHVMVTVKYAPTVAGTDTAELLLGHNGVNTSPLALTLTGTGNPVAVGELSSGTAAYPDTVVGTYQTASILLTNKGSKSMTLTSAPAVTGNAAYSATTDCGSSLAIDQSCSTTVKFMPTAQGSVTGTLTFATDSVVTPLQVALSGKGTQAYGALSASTDANFGTVETGVTASRTFTFQNTGNIGMTGVYAQLAGSDVALGGTNTCGTSSAPVALAASQSCSVTVNYTPSSVAVLTGASLTLNSTNATNRPSSIALSGVGSAPVRQLTISPAVSGRTTWDLATNGNLVISTAGVYSVTVSQATTVSAKAWGGGGGAANTNYSNTVAAMAKGGGGGYTGGNLTLQPGVTYTVVVGSAGASSTSNGAYGGGGGGKSGSRSNGGQGGGYTGIFAGAEAQANAVLMAGGGGAASGDGPYVRGGTGGGGSTVNGNAGVSAPSSGGAGTGATGMSGAKATSTYAYYGAGGGGGGYWGGGAYAGYDYYGGTGGMGYAHPTLVSGASFATGTGGGIPGNSADSLRPSGVGEGGRYPTSSAAAGKVGALVLY